MVMVCYSIEPRIRKCVKENEFLSFARNLSNKYKKQLLDAELCSLKNDSQKTVHKIGQFLRNKIADAVTKSNDNKNVKHRPVEEIITLPEKRGEI